MGVLCWIETLLAIGAAISLATYLIPFILDGYVFGEQDLKKKYNATWAVVTGASSGIGRALTEKLAKQGINVAMVALDDDLFTQVHKQMQASYPNLQFRKIGCNLSGGNYFETIQTATKDITPTLIFNNAGYIFTSLFADAPLEKQMANYECNATAAVKLTHHYANQMLDKGLKGAICFTSSPAGLMPCPISSMYGATKAFLTEFAASIAPELNPDGIDVLVVHPSPVDTGFYSGNTHKIDAMKFFQRTATSPVAIASCFFRSVGRTVVHDQGYFSLSLRMLLKLLDVNFLSIVIARMSATSADYKKVKRARGAGRR